MESKEQKTQDLLVRNVEEIIDRKHLEVALRSRKKLRVKLGIDPTGVNIHIGRAVPIWKLRAFQDLGHQIVLIIGDFTAQVGDASDKLQKRPFLSREAVEKNLQNYLPQIGKILDLKKTEVRYNSEWLAKLNFREISELADLFSFQQILERRNFKERWQKQQEISYREGLYPLMQGYDSVAVKADVELGGTDQLFNLLAGRKIQEYYGMQPQDILMTKMVPGLDGRKMSTSWGNVINIIDAPDEQFGKAMSLHDDLVVEYAESVAELPAIRKDLKSLKGKDIKALKEQVAFEIVRKYHGEKAARAAQEHFEKTFSKREFPVDAPVLKLPRKCSVLDVAVASCALPSKSEARRLIEQGGFEYSGQIYKDPYAELKPKAGDTLRLGKKRFFRVKI